jgi:Ca2+-binding RTX toxin-like protein|tara:strand:- start:165 stop:710 length:546 start_codon:yes stop_codon:yes gene_type:complete
MWLERSYLMRRPTVTAALVLLMLLTLFSHGNPVQAQVTCTGHARHLGWSYYGTAGDDLINCRGSITDVVILGLGGKDILIGGQGNDTILGGPGEDFIFGRGGRDFLNGGSERDLLFGSDGGDILVGGLGRDSLIGSKGNDVLYGGAGDDTLFGGPGMDLCDGQEGADDFAASDCEGTRNIP